MEGDFVLKSILCTFGGAALLCIASLLRVVVRAGLKDTSSVPARLLDTGACMAPTCQPPSSRPSVPLAPWPPSPHHTHTLTRSIVTDYCAAVGPRAGREKLIGVSCKQPAR